MNIKKIKLHVTEYCSFCKAEGTPKVPALWLLTLSNKRACATHRPKLADLAAERRAADRDYTEADYQTWLKL
jgi:hypothetical protein